MICYFLVMSRVICFRWPGGIHLVLAIAYFPFGIVLALLRVFIGVHAFLISCLLPKLTVIRR